MGEVALAVAIVLVAALGWDAHRRWLGDRAAARGHRREVDALDNRMMRLEASLEQHGAALDAETKRLSEVRADVNKWGKGVTDSIDAIRADVATLKMNQGLRGGR